MRHCRIGRCLLLLLAVVQPAAAEDINLLIAGDTSEWEYQTFDDIAETSYQNTGGVLEATSHAGASGYTRMQDISLYDTPWLHFRWRVLQADANSDEQTRSGDDFAWRVYFVGKDGLEYRTLTLVYSQNAAGLQWKSPYAGWLRDTHIYTLAAAEDGSQGEWQTTVFNVGELWKNTFADDGKIKLVGIMTDGDNAGITMRTQYADIILSADDAAATQ